MKYSCENIFSAFLSGNRLKHGLEIELEAAGVLIDMYSVLWFSRNRSTNLVFSKTVNSISFTKKTKRKEKKEKKALVHLHYLNQQKLSTNLK